MVSTLTLSYHHKLTYPLTQNGLLYPIHAPHIYFPRILAQHLLLWAEISLSLYSILCFPLLLVIMKPLILVYCYYDGSHNVLDTMEVFTYVDLIIIRKTYDFYHVNTLINLSNVYRWRSVTFIARPFFLLHTCYNGPTFILTHYGGNV